MLPCKTEQFQELNQILKRQTLLTTGLSLPEDIAVDWITGNLYFSDAMYMHIAVCSNDGKHCTSLITENVERPRSIALYPQEGRMYWSEWGNEPMIAVSQMDGSFAGMASISDLTIIERLKNLFAIAFNVFQLPLFVTTFTGRVV